MQRNVAGTPKPCPPGGSGKGRSAAAFSITIQRSSSHGKSFVSRWYAFEGTGGDAGSPALLLLPDRGVEGVIAADAAPPPPTAAPHPDRPTGCDRGRSPGPPHARRSRASVSGGGDRLGRPVEGGGSPARPSRDLATLGRPVHELAPGADPPGLDAEAADARARIRSRARFPGDDQGSGLGARRGRNRRAGRMGPWPRTEPGVAVVPRDPP